MGVGLMTHVHMLYVISGAIWLCHKI